jgi:hypothetical protein
LFSGGRTIFCNASRSVFLGEDGRLTEDPAEQDVLRRMRELKRAGHTVREIAGELNRQGYTTRRGTAWRFQYVAAALKAAA